MFRVLTWLRPYTCEGAVIIIKGVNEMHDFPWWWRSAANYLFQYTLVQDQQCDECIDVFGVTGLLCSISEVIGATPNGFNVRKYSRFSYSDNNLVTNDSGPRPPCGLLHSKVDGANLHLISSLQKLAVMIRVNDGLLFALRMGPTT